MLLTIDIGTANFKSALFDYEGNRTAFISIPLFSDTNKHETEPSEWLYAFEKCCQKLKGLKNADAIIISGNGPTLVPIIEEYSLIKTSRFPFKSLINFMLIPVYSLSKFCAIPLTK